MSGRKVAKVVAVALVVLAGLTALLVEHTTFGSACSDCGAGRRVHHIAFFGAPAFTFASDSATEDACVARYESVLGRPHSAHTWGGVGGFSRGQSLLARLTGRALNACGSFDDEHRRERAELALQAAARADSTEDRRAVHATVASCPPGDAAAWDELVRLFERTEKARAREVLGVWQGASWASRSPGATASVAPR